MVDQKALIKRILLKSALYSVILILTINPVISYQVIINNLSSENSLHQYETGLFNINEEETFSILMDLLKISGVDISYGDNGSTIFSMVDTSLSQIIEDLSSGNPDGLLNNPLISETMKELGVNVDQIIVDPDKINGTMKAIESYN
jgi:hypothetical protein